MYHNQLREKGEEGPPIDKCNYYNYYLATLLMGRETTKRMLPTIRDLPVSEEEDDQKTTPLLNIKEKIG